MVRSLTLGEDVGGRQEIDSEGFKGLKTASGQPSFAVYQSVY